MSPNKTILFFEGILLKIKLILSSIPGNLCILSCHKTFLYALLQFLEVTQISIVTSALNIRPMKIDTPHPILPNSLPVTRQDF